MRTLALLASTLIVAAAHAQFQAPDVLVKDVTTEVVELIAKDTDIRAGDRARLLQLIEAKVLPHFSFQAMTSLAMGQSWSKATPARSSWAIVCSALRSAICSSLPRSGPWAWSFRTMPSGRT